MFYNTLRSAGSKTFQYSLCFYRTKQSMESESMNNYVTGITIRQLREKKGITQKDLADILCVSDKTISKWETGRGLPDISLLEPLAASLGVSLTELLAGEHISNVNRSANMLRSKLYICPVCGNIIWSAGECVVSCCGIRPSLGTMSI